MKRSFSHSLLPVLATCAVAALVATVLNLPWWAGGVIGMVLALFFHTPSIALPANLVMSHPLVKLAGGLGLHAYTSVYAFQYSLWQGVLTVFLPGIAEVYWFISSALRHQTLRQPFCVVMTFAFVLWLHSRFIFPWALATWTRAARADRQRRVGSLPDSTTRPSKAAAPTQDHRTAPGQPEASDAILEARRGALVDRVGKMPASPLRDKILAAIGAAREAGHFDQLDEFIEQYAQPKQGPAVGAADAPDAEAATTASAEVTQLPHDEKPSEESQRLFAPITRKLVEEANLAVKADRRRREEAASQQDWRDEQSESQPCSPGPSAEDETADTMELRHPVSIVLHPMGGKNSELRRTSIQLDGKLPTKLANALLSQGLLTQADFLPTTSGGGQSGVPQK